MSVGSCPTGEHHDGWCCERCDHGITAAPCDCEELRENAEDLARALRTVLTSSSIKSGENHGDA